MDLVTLHRRTTEAWTRSVAGVTALNLDRPTPCTDWSVRDLTNHVVGEDLWTVPLMRGKTVAEVGQRLDGDLIGDDPHGAARAAASAAEAVVEDALPKGGTVHLSYGDEDAEEYVRQLCADHLVHSWDLSVATGADPRLDPELVAEVAAWFAGREEVYRSAGAVGPRPQADPDDPQAQLLAGFGRDASWTAP